MISIVSESLAWIIVGEGAVIQSSFRLPNAVQSISILTGSSESVSYTHLTLPTKA